MADNLCGPSNPSKGLADHLSRDRSAQQVRFNSGPVSGETFRSTPQSSGASDAAFERFLAGQGSLPPIGVENFAQSPVYLPHGIFQGPHGVQSAVPSPVYAAPNGPANVSWVQDFQRMQLGQQQQQQQLSQDLKSRHQMSSTRAGVVTRSQPTTFAPPTSIQSQGSLYQFSPIHQIPSSVIEARHENYPLDVAMTSSSIDALNAVFAACDAEFEAEVNKWKGEHGPNAAVQSSATVHKAADSQTIAPDEQTLQDRAKQQAEQDSLRRAANEVLETLNKDQSDKFQTSSFVELMRRLTSQEVVLEDNNLVEASTGQPLVPRITVDGQALAVAPAHPASTTSTSTAWYKTASIVDAGLNCE